MKEWIKKYWYYLAGFVIFFVFIRLGMITSQEQEVVMEEPETLVSEVEKVDEDRIKVDVKGAVVHPGVYELELGSRVEDVIQKSGGVKESADTSTLNLSKRLEDEMVVMVYTKEEVKEKTCYCSMQGSGTSGTKESYSSTYSKDNTNQKINVNQATLEDFTSLPGIGVSKAQAIIDYRVQNGSFQTIEDLKKVSGIGDSVYAKIKAYLTI